MKRAFLICILTEMAFASIIAAPVDRTAALISAEKFLAERGVTTGLTPCPTERTGRSPEAADEPFHIFNLNDGNGYVVIAGDDRAQTVLAYSDSGSLDFSSMPETCKAWLQQYADQILSLPTEQTASATERKTPLIYSQTPVAPLLKSKWDQAAPYNNLCPTDKTTGSRCLTGCVATATAQVMYHHRYPERPVGTITYDDNAQGLTRTFDFTTVGAFDWDAMTDTYSSASPDNSKLAVATLMNAAGHAMRMQYSPNTSMTAIRYAIDALVNHFDYDKNIHYYERRFMTDQEWVDVVTAEVQAGRPIIYDGRNTSMGHSFVCDGYDGKGFYHFNWGWSGMSDGYYSLSALIPTQQSSGGSDNGYTHSQSIICHIAPPGREDSTPQTDYLLSIRELYFRDANAYYVADATSAISSPLSAAQLFFYVDNIGYSNFEGEVWAVRTDNGSVTPILKGTPVQGTYSTGYTFPLSEAKLEDGSYTIGFYYRLNGSETLHRMPTVPGRPSTCLATVNGENVTLSQVPALSDVMLASDFEPGTIYAGKNKVWTLDILNNGNQRLEAYAGVALMKADGSDAKYFTTQILCPADDSISVIVNANLRNVEAGEYLAMPFYSLTSNPSATDIKPFSRPMNVTVATFPSLVVLPTGNASYFSMDKGDQSVDVQITNLGTALHEGTMTATVSKTDGTVYPGTLSADFSIDANASNTVTLKANGLDIEKGNHYINFYIGEGAEHHVATSVIMVTDNQSALESVNLNPAEIIIEAGRITVTSDRNISSVRLTDMSGRSISAMTVNSHDAEITTSDLADGVYILIVNTDGNEPMVKKLVIRK